MVCLLVRETNQHAPAQGQPADTTSGFGDFLRRIGYQSAILTLSSPEQVHQARRTFDHAAEFADIGSGSGAEFMPGPS